MKKEKKFTLEKFQVAKLKNLKQIIGGNNTTNGGNGDTVYTTTGGDGTSIDKQGSSSCDD